MTYRALFLDAEHARAAAAALAGDGFHAQVVRHAGPDGQDDWVLVSDAPAVVVELLVERYDGWLET